MNHEKKKNDENQVMEPISNQIKKIQKYERKIEKKQNKEKILLLKIKRKH